MENDKLNTRVEQLNNAAASISTSIERLVIHASDDRYKSEATTIRDTMTAIDGALTIAASIAITMAEFTATLNSISGSVGRIAEVVERDYDDAIKDAATHIAEIAQEDQKKRSWIGKKD